MNAPTPTDEEAPIAGLNELPDSIDPPRDLWPTIAARLDAARSTPAPEAPVAPVEPAGWRRWLDRVRLLTVVPAIAVAAAVVVVVVRPGSEEPEPAVVTPPAAHAPSADARASGGAPDLSEALHAYRRAAADLRAAVEASSGAFHGTTQRAVRENLDAADQAIANLEAAIEEHPEDPDLVELLLSAHASRLAALEQVLTAAHRSGASG